MDSEWGKKFVVILVDDPKMFGTVGTRVRGAGCTYRYSERFQPSLFCEHLAGVGNCSDFRIRFRLVLISCSVLAQCSDSRRQSFAVPILRRWPRFVLILGRGCLKSGEFMSVFVGALILSRGCRKSSDLGAFLKLGSDSE